MTQSLFIISILIDQTANGKSISNINYNTYDLIDFYFI